MAELSAATLLGVGGFLLRGLWHLDHVLDRETAFVNTAGRELSLGSPASISEFQFIAYQGSNLVDAFLSRLGYAFFGDSPWAWLIVPVLYLVLYVGLVASLAARAGGRAGLWCWCLLAAASPFVIKDGLLAMPGAHASAVVFAIGAVWVLERGETARAAVLAGILASLGTWYTRTTILVFPVLFVEAARRGRPSVLGTVGGLVVLPILLVGNWLALRFAGPWASSPAPQGLGSRMLWNVYEIGKREPALAPKLAEVTSLAEWRLLFAPVRALPGEEVAAGLVAAGGPWAFALAAVAIVSAARTAGVRRRSVLLPAVALLYVASYVVSPLRIEPELFLLDCSPLPSSTRYIAAPLLMLLACLGIELASLVRGPGRARHVGAALAAALILPGLIATLGDRSSRAPEQWASRTAFSYYRSHSPARGPSRESHASWRSTDPLSERNRLRVLGAWISAGPLGVRDDPRQFSHGLDALRDELALSPGETAVAAEGLGREFADHLWSSGDFPGADLVRLAVSCGEHMGDAEKEAFLRGFARVAQEAPDLAGLPTGDGCTGPTASPLCIISGHAFAFDCSGPPPSGLGLWEAEAAGWAQGRMLPPWEMDACAARLTGEARVRYLRSWSAASEPLWARAFPAAPL